jgi:plasmid segregation protein ParM
VKEKTVSGSSVVRAIDVGYGWTKYIERLDDGNLHTASFPSEAPFASDRAVSEALGHQRKTVELQIDGDRFEVGPDVKLARGDYYARIDTAR